MRRPLVTIDAPCACGVDVAAHVCRICGGQFDHEHLVRVGAGFACRVPCQAPAVRRVVGKPW